MIIKMKPLLQVSKFPVLHDILKDYDDNKETKDEESDKRGKTQRMLYQFIKIII